MHRQISQKGTGSGKIDVAGQSLITSQLDQADQCGGLGNAVSATDEHDEAGVRLL